MTPQLGTWVTRRLPETPILPILRPHHGRASNRNPQPLPHAGPDRHLPRFVVIGKLLEDSEIEPLRQEYDRLFDEARDGDRYRNLSADGGAAQRHDEGAAEEMLQIMQDW